MGRRKRARLPDIAEPIIDLVEAVMQDIGKQEVDEGEDSNNKENRKLFGLDGQKNNGHYYNSPHQPIYDDIQNKVIRKTKKNETKSFNAFSVALFYICLQKCK